MFQCPACGELVEALTNLHCLSRHQRTKRDFLVEYGAPKYITPTMTREVQQWIKESQIIGKLDFELAQAAARNQYKK